MGGSGQQRAEDEEVQRALQEIHAGGRPGAHSVDSLPYIL
jgi:hypothetical protein